MKFLHFFKKQETIASLALECDLLYKKFIENFSETHFPSYIDFKYLIQKDFIYLKDRISVTQDSDIAFLLLKHLKNQLSFINKNSFHLTHQHLSSFVRTYYPYHEVIDKMIISKEVPLLSHRNIF